MLEFDEGIVVFEKIVSVLDIIRENLPEFMSSTANTDDDIIDPQPLDSSELPIISPSFPEALGHLDSLTTFFQSMSISTPVFSYYFSNFQVTSYVL